jgi:hypothetical protein
VHGKTIEFLHRDVVVNHLKEMNLSPVSNLPASILTANASYDPPRQQAARSATPDTWVNVMRQFKPLMRFVGRCLSLFQNRL